MLSATDQRKLKQSELFGKLDAALLLSLIERKECRVASFEAGATVLSPKTEGRMAGIVLCGTAVAETLAPDRPTPLRHLKTGDAFGIANLFTSAPFVSHIRAETDCKIFFLSEEAMRTLLEEDKDFMYRYLAFLSGRIGYLNRKIGYLTAGSAEGRLALYLCSLPEDDFRLDTSISHLSELLDLGRASLYRAFSRLEADGYLVKNGRDFCIRDREALKKAYQ